MPYVRFERVVPAERLALRDKVVASSLALGTAMLMVMMGLGAVHALALVFLAPVLALPAIRARVFPFERETFAAYYVAWLYGPLGWGVYRNCPWVQALGIATIAVVIAGVVVA
jgi:hypothetical protein